MPKITYQKPGLVDLNGKNTARGQQCQNGSTNTTSNCRSGISALSKQCMSGGTPGRRCKTGGTK